jgi:hypothetical protein
MEYDTKTRKFALSSTARCGITCHFTMLECP